MFLTEDHYYTINKPFLKALGIWVYDKSRIVTLQRVLVLLVLLLYSVQLLIFVIKNYTWDIFLQIMAIFLPLIAVIALYLFSMLKTETIINIHHQIRDDWNLLRDKEECDIMEQNAYFGKNLIRYLFVLLSVLVISPVVLQFLPDILDFILPLDEPRPRELIFTVEYFVPDDKYFYYKAIHELMSIGLGWIIGVTTLTQLLGFIFHSFGLLKLAKYRIRKSIEDCVLHISYLEKEHALCNVIMHAAIAHRRATEFATSLTASVNDLLCIMSIVSLISGILDLYGIFEALVISPNMEVLITCSFSVLGVLLFIFFGHFIAQKLTDCTGELSVYVYGTSWYLMPLSSQKLILFLIQHTNNEFTVSVGNILVGKIESFVMVLKAMLSYVTVLYNVHHG